MKNNLMISVSGIRGIVGEGLTPPVLVDFISAFAQYSKKGTIVIGRDTRKSGPAVLNIVTGTLMACGCKVIDLGIVSTPTVEIMVKEFGASGGIVITASHNPGEWNALKFIGNKGMFLNKTQADELLEIYNSKNFSYVSSDSIGEVEKYDNANIKHVDYILSKIDVDNIKKKKIKVILDSCNGAGSEITPILLERLGCFVEKINCSVDKDFPRNPEPIAENLSKTIKFVSSKDADVCFIQDPDADRLAILSEKGEFIGEEYSLVLAAKYILSNNPGNIAVNLSTSMMIDKVAKKYNVNVARTKVGEINVAQDMLLSGSVIGGEGNGGVICPMFHYGRDSLVGIVLILSLMAETGKSISELVCDIPRFVMKKIKVEGVTKELLSSKFEDMKMSFFDYKIDLLDGFKFIWDDKWIHIRPSNTEPIVRIIAEAKTEKEVDELINKVISRLT